MPRKLYLMIAILIAGGALAQPQQEAVSHILKRSAGTSIDQKKNNRKIIRSEKNDTNGSHGSDRRSAAREVWIKGRLLVVDDRMDDVEMIVEVQNGECRSARLKKNGRFDLVLPAGSRARLTFQKPGHIFKEVLVDASDLKGDLIGRSEDRKVNFDVILVPEEHYPGFRLDGPVGSIVFRRGSNALTVDYHEKLVAIEQACPRRK